MLRALDINKNKICLNNINENDNNFILYNIISNLYLCNPKYLIVKEENDNNNFSLFIDYFESH